MRATDTPSPSAAAVATAVPVPAATQAASPTHLPSVPPAYTVTATPSQTLAPAPAPTRTPEPVPAVMPSPTEMPRTPSSASVAALEPGVTYIRVVGGLMDECEALTERLMAQELAPSVVSGDRSVAIEAVEIELHSLVDRWRGVERPGLYAASTGSTRTR